MALSLWTMCKKKRSSGERKISCLVRFNICISYDRKLISSQTCNSVLLEASVDLSLQLSVAVQTAAGDCGRVQRKPEFCLGPLRGDGYCCRFCNFPLTPVLCRQLMFICSAHLGLVTKHLVGLPLCRECFTE